jgi:hypothetical protein
MAKRELKSEERAGGSNRLAVLNSGGVPKHKKFDYDIALIKLGK